ncbi:MAG: S46 family peptidase [Anaeromyxobacter sp.]
MLALAAVLALACSARAEEGMWMPQQIPDLAGRLQTLGFKGDAKAFADLTGQPMGAIVSLGGCSASFVSPDGLIATNHHCIQGALQYNSTPERDLVEDGYVARTRDEELSNGPGSRVYVTVSVKEVTDEVVGKLDPRMDDVARAKLVEKRVKDETGKCEKMGLRCTVSSFFEGARYFAIGQLEIEDVRLVYAPQNNVGNFGGEVDNWMWPRHSGDFSLYRAYVGKDGKSRPFSKENVPYRPAHHLPVNTAGISPGELALVAGYPGRTYRLQTVAEVKDMLEWQYPRTVRRYGDMLAILADLSAKSRATGIKVTTRVRGLANTMKKMKGVIEGAARLNILGELAGEEQALQAWIEADARRKKEWGDVIGKIDAIQAQRAQTRERDALFAELMPAGGRSASFMSTARTLWKMADERPKPDAERQPDFMQRNWTRLREGLERLDRSLDVGADRALLRYTLADVAALPAASRIPAVDAAVGLAPGLAKEEAAKKIDAFLDGLYASTKLGDKAARLELFEKASRKDLQSSTDGFVKLAIALAPMEKELETQKYAREGARSRWAPLYAKARLAKAGGLLSPDANGTLRVTYGLVEGVVPRDGMVYVPQTRLAGVLEKHKAGDADFDVPAPVREAIKAQEAAGKGPWVDPKLGDVPVNTLASVDITGGNSGSAVMNGKGEFVGLMFDGTWESITSDLAFDPASTRSIFVDVRYLLWSLQNVAKATNLLEELGVKAGAAGN